jgi:hypothetical protein
MSNPRQRFELSYGELHAIASEFYKIASESEKKAEQATDETIRNDWLQFAADALAKAELFHQWYTAVEERKPIEIVLVDQHGNKRFFD